MQNVIGTGAGSIELPASLHLGLSEVHSLDICCQSHVMCSEPTIMYIPFDRTPLIGRGSSHMRDSNSLTTPGKATTCAVFDGSRAVVVACRRFKPTDRVHRSVRSRRLVSRRHPETSRPPRDPSCERARSSTSSRVSSFGRLVASDKRERCVDLRENFSLRMSVASTFIASPVDEELAQDPCSERNERARSRPQRHTRAIPTS